MFQEYFLVSTNMIELSHYHYVSQFLFWSEFKNNIIVRTVEIFLYVISFSIEQILFINVQAFFKRNEVKL